MDKIEQSMIDGLITALAAKLGLTGGTLTGDILIDKSTPKLTLDKSASGQINQIMGLTAAKNRWSLELGNAVPESGSNAGSNFAISRMNDAGTYVDIPFEINRASGDILTKGRKLIEYINNGNGEALRFFDGTQVTWRQSAHGSRAPNQVHNDSYTFPAAFATGQIPVIVGSVAEYGNTSAGGAQFTTLEATANNTTGWLRGKFDYTGNLTYTTRWMAIGRWY